VPQSDFYQRLANAAASHAVTVDLYVCASGYVDIATQSALVNTTGGQLYMYPGFNARKDAEALQHDLLSNVTRETGFDAVMVVRTSAGLKVAEYYGNFFNRRPHEMELPSIDCEKAFGIRVEHEGKLEDKSEACFQVALLYTTKGGERRIRVHTIAAPVTSVMANIFRYSDLDTIVNLSMKQVIPLAALDFLICPPSSL
jgi:protein transport protein SEC24